MKKLNLLFLLLFLTQCSKSQTLQLKESGGVLIVKAKFNNVLTLPCILDTGAAEICIPMCVANTLIKTGTLVYEDVLENQNYILANGSVETCKRFNLKSLKIGNKTIYNVEVSVSNSDEASILLGLNAIKKFKIRKIMLDKKIIVIPY
jgi:aspartyl protease family protein